MKPWLAAALALAVTSCAPYPIEPAAPSTAPARPAPAAPAPTPAPQPPPRVVVPPPAPRSPVPRPQANDQCGAAELQRLVGRPRSEIPVPLDPSRQRVACTTCPVTMDFNPVRLNFFFDAATGLIKEIRCG